MNSNMKQQLSYNFVQLGKAIDKQDWTDARYIATYIDGMLTALLKVKKIKFSEWVEHHDIIKPFLKN